MKGKMSEKGLLLLLKKFAPPVIQFYKNFLTLSFFNSVSYFHPVPTEKNEFLSFFQSKIPFSGFTRNRVVKTGSIFNLQ
jgi:hypothetical protein